MKTYNRLIPAVAGAVLIAAGVMGLGGAIKTVLAQEHPMEHPSEEKAAAKKHPMDLKAEFTGAVEEYVKKTLAEKGTLPVQDVHGKDVPLPGTLTLEKIHKDKIIRYKDDTYFACSDFLEKDGKKETKLDLDFFMTKSGDQWTTDRILLHKINGKLQMTYVNNEPTPVE